MAACTPVAEGAPEGGAGATSASATGAGAIAGTDSVAPVRPGARVLLEDSLHLVAGRRVGLITNHTGIVDVDGEIRSTIDLLHEHPDVDLVALYGPEHGLRGEAEAGEKVDDGVDDRTGLPIFSLYGSTRAPTPEMLQGVDVLLFDIQDVGARYYTYVWTMALSMRAAADAGIDFVVLDRPNPIGPVVQGNLLDPDFATFVGLYPVPMRHGMTPGELARMIAAEFDPGPVPAVVPADGLEPGMPWRTTGLPWVAPSPNMPSVESALHYPGTCLFEGTNLSVGRGTEAPFQWVGAPFLDGEALAAELNALDLAGVRFEAVRFTPQGAGDGKFDGVEVGGVRFVGTDPDGRVVDPTERVPGLYDPVRAAVWALFMARRQAGDAWEWIPSHFDRLAGTDRLREVIDSGDEAAVRGLLSEWREDEARFERDRAPYLIYGTGR